jgi:hypothetical protein
MPILGEDEFKGVINVRHGNDLTFATFSAEY